MSRALTLARERVEGEQLGKVLSGRYSVKQDAVLATVVSRNAVQIGGQFYDAELDAAEAGKVVQVVNMGRPGAAKYMSAASATVAAVTASVPATSGGGGGSLVAHAIDGAHHTGTLQAYQAPWALAMDGSRSLTGNLTVATNITIDGVDLSAHAANVNAHHNRSHALDSASDHTGLLPWAWLDKTSSSLGDLATRNYTQLNNRTHDILSEHSYTGGAALEVFGLSAANMLARLTPLADASGGANALLRSGSGGLTLDGLTAVAWVRTPLLAYPGGDMTIAPAGDLTLNPGGGDVILPQADVLRSDNYLAGFPLAGFRIGPTGVAGQSGMNIGTLEADELRARIFVADETRVDRGQEYITKSYGVLSRAFTAPAAVDGTAHIYFENSPHIAGAIFSTNDWILLRYLDMSGGITLTSVWGQVSAYTTAGLTGEQRWTFTLRSGTTGLEFGKGSFAVNFGATGQGYILSDAITSTSPFIQIGKWVTNPYTPANRSVVTQIGRLDGAGFTGEYGLAAAVDNFTASGKWLKMATGGAEQNNVDSTWTTGGSNLLTIDATGGITLYTTDVYDWSRGYSFSNGSTVIGGIQGRFTTTENLIFISAVDTAGHVGKLWMTGGDSIYIYSGGASIDLDATTDKVVITGDTVIDNSTLDVGGRIQLGFTGWVEAGVGSVTTVSYGFRNDLDTGIYSPNPDEVGIVAGGTKRLEVNAGGVDVTGALTTTANAAIGTSATIGTTLVAGSTVSVDPSNTNGVALLGQASLQLGHGRSADGIAYIDFVGDATYSDFGMRIYRNTGGANTESLIRHHGTGALRFFCDEAGPIEMYTAATRRFTVQSDGLIAVGAHTATSKLDVDGNARALGFFADGEGGGVAGTTGLSNGTSTVSTGTGTVKLAGTTARNSDLWLKFYVGTTPYYVPAWSNIS